MTTLLTYLLALSSGIGITLILTICSVAVGLVLAIIFVMVSLTDHQLIKKMIAAFIFFMRGTPLLVQIFLIYYGLGQFEWLRDSYVWILLRSPMFCAILALSLNSACYTTIILQGGLKSVPHNERDACLAMGMSKWLALRRIIFPRAFRIALPAYSNEVVMVLKGTSLASTITLLDVMGVTQQLIAQTYDTVTLYCVAGVIYLLLNAGISMMFHYFLRQQLPSHQA